MKPGSSGSADFPRGKALTSSKKSDNPSNLMHGHWKATSGTDSQCRASKTNQLQDISEEGDVASMSDDAATRIERAEELDFSNP